MKKITFLVSLFFLIGSTSAQNIKVSESTEKIGDGVHPVFITTIYDSSPEEVEKEWKSSLKSFKSEKISSKDGVFADNIFISAITDGTIDIYARAEKTKIGETKLIVAFDMGGAYLASSLNNAKAYDAATTMLADFARKTTKNALAELIKEAQKSLDKLKDQQKELEDKNSDLLKDIENYKSKISKAENDISENKSEQSKKKAEIESQSKAVDEITIKEKNIK
jgi:DNA repair exonuclease SbcCD ATPase subunit